MSKFQSFQLPLLSILALIAVVQAQYQLGFISIDCGIENEYTDATTKLDYVSDSGFIDTGISKNISVEYTTYLTNEQLQTLRSFREGERNCYEIRVTNGTKYLIRAVFFYGNYDSKKKAPIFDLYLGSKKWDTVDTVNSTMITTKEIIHVPTSNYIYVCLVNTGLGIPFISTLEFRPLKDTTYNTDFGSLVRFSRSDYASMTNQTVRYPDDVFDRIWLPDHFSGWKEINAAETVDYDGDKNNYQLPSVVMRSAATAADPDQPMQLNIVTKKTHNFLVYMHFAEVEGPWITVENTRGITAQSLAPTPPIAPEGQSRKFSISFDGQFWPGPITPDSRYTTTVESPSLLKGGNYQFSLVKAEDSTLPPLINAIEVFYTLDLSQSMSHQEDVDAIKKIKKSYKIKRNWQGDPCAPHEYIWEGLNCSYPENDVPRIISLNLSSIRLTGEIPSSISSLTSLQSLDLSNNDLTGLVPVFLSELSSLKVLNLSSIRLTGEIPSSISSLTSLQSLDLSNNNLTGRVPDFLSELSSLKVLILARNKLSGSVPAKLLEKSNQKLMELSVGGNPNLCPTSSCESKKKMNSIVPIAVSIVGVIIFVAAVATFCCMLIKRRRTQQGAKEEESKPNNESNRRHFTYSEVVSMTNDFQKVLGKGGFGTVYHGHLDDSEVAVKMLSPSSAQGYKQFQAEVSLLLRVHHRNLTSLVGFFEEGTQMGLIYEYMANGDIDNLMSGSNRNEFGWERRLQVVVEAAQGLEYLHNGCKPPIVHRDIKPSNILLNKKFQAKLADFGLSRSFPLEGETHISTVVAGTPGYLEPEYYGTSWLTEKSDVYSFGIVILNMMTGKRAITVVDGKNMHICQWVKSLLENGDIKNVVDPSIGEDFNMNSMWKAVEIAMACTSPVSSRRPTMHQVVTELNECLAEETARKKLQRKETEYSMGSMEMVTHTSPLAR